MNTDKARSDSYPRSSALIGGPYLFRLLTHLAKVFLLRYKKRRINERPLCDGVHACAGIDCPQGKSVKTFDLCVGCKNFFHPGYEAHRPLCRADGMRKRDIRICESPARRIVRCLINDPDGRSSR